MTGTTWMKPDPERSNLPAVDLRTNRPHPARIYDFLLGGKTNFAADRAAAEAEIKANPHGKVPAQENRAFLTRAVRHLTQAGIRQFLDIGTGIPTAPNVHEVAQAIAPQSRVVYVDNDPIVLTHARALLTSTPQGQTRYIEADLRGVGAILASPQLRETLDLDQPVGLLLIAIMPFIPDSDDPYGIVEELLADLPSGSYLALSHLTGDFDPAAWAAVVEIYRRNNIAMQVRSRADIERFFHGLELVEPGVELVTRWRPEPTAESSADQVRELPDAAVCVYGGVARKP